MTGQSYKVSCPEEVAYKNKWIDGKQLLKIVKLEYTKTYEFIIPVDTTVYMWFMKFKYLIRKII